MGKKGGRERKLCHGKEEMKRNGGKEKEISAGTVTNKSPQHDSLLLKHFIFPQHNGVLLPIICSVSARAESILNEGQLHLAAVFSAVFSCHGDQLFLGEPARKARGNQVEGGAKAARGRGVRVGSERRARGQGQGNDRRKSGKNCIVTLCSHLVSQPFGKHAHIPGAQCSTVTFESPLDSKLSSFGVLKQSQMPSFYSICFSRPTLTPSPLTW